MTNLIDLKYFFKYKIYIYIYIYIVQELQGLPISTLSDQQICSLNVHISDKEIEDIVFQLGSHKAPGPNGIPAFFFQHFWDIVKPDVISTIQVFFHSGSLGRSLNHTLITLVPKIGFPQEVSHFRPISLCNVLYKVISKIMVNRLKPFMDSIISPYQNAFIQGRNISDNILLMRLWIHIERRKVENTVLEL